MNKSYQDQGLSITFWAKKGGRFAMSVQSGLTAEQVAELQKLQVGDQLVIYTNDKKSERSPDYSLRKFIHREGYGGGL